MPRLAMVTLLVAGCGVFDGNRVGPEIPIEELEPLAPVSGGASAVQVFEVYEGFGLRTRTWADTDGAYVFGYVTDGIDEQLLDAEGDGLVVRRVQADGTVEDLPLPDLDLTDDNAGEVLADLVFVPTTQPGFLAVRHEDTLHTLDTLAPDPAWSSRALPADVPPLTEVSPERGLIRESLDSARLVENQDVRTLPAPAIADQQGYAFGPFDGDAIVRIAWTESTVCMDRFYLRSDEAIELGCLDLQNRIVGVERGIIGGSVEEPQVVIRGAGRGNPMWWLVGGGDGVVYQGTFDITSTDISYRGVPDDPQLDALQVARFGYDHVEFFEADGGWSWVRDADDSVLKPALTCDCPAEARPEDCRCLDRDVGVDFLRWVGPGDAVIAGQQVLDARRWLHVRFEDTRPTVSTTADPERPVVDTPLGPDSAHVRLLGRAPGFPSEELYDLSACSRVFQEDGTEIPLEDEGFLLEDLQTYTARTETCQPPDGGPPLQDVEVTNGSEIGFSLGYVDVAFGRGLRLDPADQPPRIVGAVDVEAFIVREESGWTLVDLDAEDVPRKRTVDAPDAEAPVFVQDGRRVLLDGGRVWDSASGEIVDTIDLGVPPSEGRWLARGRIFVEDEPSRLAVWTVDTDGGFTEVHDARGARSEVLWDVDDAGEVALVESGGRLRARALATGLSADLGDTGVAVDGAWISGDGAWALVSIDVAGTGRTPFAYTLWALGEVSDGASPRVLCERCRGAVVVHREGGQVALNHELSQWRLHTPSGDPDGTWSVAAVDIASGNAFAASRRSDRHGRAMLSSGFDARVLDLETGASVLLEDALIDRDTLAVDAWHGPAWVAPTRSGLWYRWTEDGALPHHEWGTGRPWPLAEGRAILPVGEALEAGTWSPGTTEVSDRYEVSLFGTAVPDLATDQSPLAASWPCLPVTLPDQPAYVLDSPGMVCLR